MNYDDLWTLPVVPNPKYNSKERLTNRAMNTELKKHNSKFFRIQAQFLEDLNDEENDKTYLDCFHDMKDAWEFVTNRMKFKYTIPNNNFLRRFQPIEHYDNNKRRSAKTFK